MLLQFFFTTCVTSKKLLQKTRRNNPRSGFPGFRYSLITVELPAIPQQRFAPFQSLPQKKSLAATADNLHYLASLLKLLSQFCH